MTHGTTVFLSCRVTVFLVMSSSRYSCHVERPTGVETSLHTSALKISPLTVLLPQAARCKSPPDCLLVVRDSRNDKWSNRFSCHVERLFFLSCQMTFCYCHVERPFFLSCRVIIFLVMSSDHRESRHLYTRLL